MAEADGGGCAHALVRAAAARIPGDTPRLDAELLMAHVLGCGRNALLLADRAVAPEVAARFEALVTRRVARREPVDRIVGLREFWSLPISVTPDVLSPRADSETLIAGALAAFRANGRAPRTVLDLGTGSGALLCAALAEWRDARGLGTERSPAAARVARANLEALGLSPRGGVIVADWDAAVGASNFDLLLCNPPYVADGASLMPEVARHDPPAALYAGPDGLAALGQLIPAAPRLVAPGGVALFEFGDGQADAVSALGGATGLEAEVLPDLAGRPRALRLVRA